MTSRTALPANPFRSPERALPAQTRLDEYEIERVLAQSSFSVVYRAYDHALKLHVAIKEYLPDALALRSAETQVVLRARSHAERFDLGLQAFVGEAQTLARSDHPSLLRILRVLQRHGTAYRVMRYTPGPTLLEHRRELAAVPDAALMRRWLDALLDAIETLHEEGCVHGAVAPGNILLLHGGKPLLLDFDAVRTALISDRTQSMMAALEPCFEPPEQREAGEAAMGPWTDLYSLAATLHFCISGHLPAPPSGPAVAFEPLNAVWQRLLAAQPGLGDAPGWLPVLDACLDPRAAARPQSVAELRGRLESLQPAPRRPPAPRAAPRVVLLDDEVMVAAAAPPKPIPAAAAAPVVAPPPPRPAPPPLSPPPLSPPPTAAPVDPAHAKVIADLDQTFAFIAAQANEDAAKPPAPAEAPSEAPQAQESPATALSRLNPRQQLWLAVAAVALVLLLLALAVVWMFRAYDAGGLGGAALGNANAAAGAWPAASVPSPQALMPPAPMPLEPSPPAAGRTAGASGDAARAVRPEPPAPRQTARAPDSPREICGKRERYALLQCMQTQCAKKSWAQHEQCVRLRKERKL